MNRELPGAVAVEGREFLYVENSGHKTFHLWMEDVFSETPNVPVPVSGGVIEEKASIRLSNGTLFDGLSYKGDSLGWRNKIVAFCENHHKLVATIKGNALIVSDGQVIPLSDCKIQVQQK